MEYLGRAGRPWASLVRGATARATLHDPHAWPRCRHVRLLQVGSRARLGRATATTVGDVERTLANCREGQLQLVSEPSRCGLPALKTVSGARTPGVRLRNPRRLSNLIMWDLWFHIMELTEHRTRRCRVSEPGEQRDPGAGPRRPAGLLRGPGRRAPVVRRPPGVQRAGQVDDLADARGAGARRPAGARRRRWLRRRQPVLAVRRAARPVGGAGPPGPPGDGAGRRRHPGVGAPLGDPRRQGRAGRPGRLPLPARDPRLDRDRRTCPHLGPRQGLPRLGSALDPRRAARQAHPRDHHQQGRRSTATAARPGAGATPPPSTSSRTA